MTRRRWVVVGAALALLVSGCGGTDSPADAVPALSGQLDRVDAAISAGRYAVARSALDDLTDETERAQTDGTLDGGDAAAILTAISALEEQLPRPEAAPSATTSTTPSATPSATPLTEPEDDQPEHAGPKPKPEKKPKPPKHDKKPHPKPGHGHGH